MESAAGHPVAMEVLKADPNRQSVPSLVRSPRWLQPFEELVTTFGISSYNELDPTLIVTVSFLIMYGMMFGDLGHGLILLLAGLWLRRRKLGLGFWWRPRGERHVVRPALRRGVRPRRSCAPPGSGRWKASGPSCSPPWRAAWCCSTSALRMNLVNAWRVRGTGRACSWRRTDWSGIVLYWTLLGGGLGVGFGMLPKRVLLLIPVLCALLWIHEPLGQMDLAASVRSAWARRWSPASLNCSKP